jgi:hypothetical protein
MAYNSGKLDQNSSMGMITDNSQMGILNDHQQPILIMAPKANDMGTGI